ncbi:DUF1515 family protein [Ensifer adhaerens]|uniref:DUF1515 family protein n=1 Tax=Ensifer adhaerens TaxID=106592 RepID=UPI003CF748A0
MNQLVDRVGHPEASAITIGEEVSEMKLVTDDVTRWKLRHRCARRPWNCGQGARVVTPRRYGGSSS